MRINIRYKVEPRMVTTIENVIRYEVDNGCGEGLFTIIDENETFIVPLHNVYYVQVQK